MMILNRGWVGGWCGSVCLANGVLLFCALRVSAGGHVDDDAQDSGMSGGWIG